MLCCDCLEPANLGYGDRSNSLTQRFHNYTYSPLTCD
ncbi:unnamed protein product [Brassica rapa subsp. trilocularis]